MIQKFRKKPILKGLNTKCSLCDKETSIAFFEKVKQDKIDKLLAVGFSADQAKVLLEIIKTENSGFGLF